VSSVAWSGGRRSVQRLDKAGVEEAVKLVFRLQTVWRSSYAFAVSSADEVESSQSKAFWVVSATFP
jgi:hypothetical protein